MSNGIDRIISTGHPQGSGASAKYVFTCLSCGQQMVTRQEYPTGQNSIVGGTITGTMASSLSSIFYRIPVVGSIIGGIISRTVAERQSQSQGADMEQSKNRAFEELRDRFVQCTRCGNWACVSCVVNGLCRSCAMMTQATRESSMGKEEGAQTERADSAQTWNEKNKETSKLFINF